MKKRNILFITICIMVMNYSSLMYAQQITFSKIYSGYSYGDPSFSVVKTIDNNYMVAGVEQNDALIIKIDSTGDVLWNKKIGNNKNEIFADITVTRDSCYVMAGSIFNTPDSANDIFCVKVNSNGDTLWSKEIDMGYSDYALSIQQTYDNGFILAGYSVQDTTPNSLIAVLKLDVSGNIMWGNTYTGCDFNNYGYEVKQTPDSGYVVVGYTDSLTVDDDRAFLMKLNPAGNIAWAKKHLVLSQNYTRACDVVVTAGGLFCYLISNSSNKGIIMKTDFYGNELWSKEYSGSWEFYFFNVPELHPSGDSGFVFISNPFSLLKIDTAGNPLWEKDWMLFPLNDFLETPDKGILVLGSPQIITKPSKKYYDGTICLIKTDSLGNTILYCDASTYVPPAAVFPADMIPLSFTSEATAVAVSSHPAISYFPLLTQDGCILGAIEENNAGKEEISIYPNPATDLLYLELFQKSEIQILNAEGQILKTINTKEKNTTIDISDFAKGIYFVKVKTDKGIAVKKFVKE